jgi:hypothetical protein
VLADNLLLEKEAHTGPPRAGTLPPDRPAHLVLDGLRIRITA